MVNIEQIIRIQVNGQKRKPHKATALDIKSMIFINVTTNDIDRV